MTKTTLRERLHWAIHHSWATDLWALGKGLALVTATAPLMTNIYLLLVMVLSITPVLQVWMVKLVVDQLTINSTPDGRIWLFIYTQIYLLTLIVSAGLEPTVRTLSASLEDRAVGEVDRRLIQAGTRLADLVRIERPEFGDELRLIEGAAYAPTRLPTLLHDGLGRVITLIGLFLLLARLHPLLPIALAAVLVPHLANERRLSMLMWQAMEQRSRAAREMDYCARIVTEPAAAKEVRVFGVGDFFLRRFRERCAAALTEVDQVRLQQLRSSALFGGIHALVLAGGFAYVASHSGDGQITMGDLALYLNIILQAERLTLNLPHWFSLLSQSILHLRGLFVFLDQASVHISLPPDGEEQLVPAALQIGIEFRHVHFRYPEGVGSVLEDLTATIPAGKVTALIGVNGAGKSTLVKLLTRMYDPSNGEILIDGVPLMAYHLDALRRRIAVVYQDFARFSLTLGENISVGLAAEQRDMDFIDVERAAHWSGTDAVAAKLPQGFDTPLTRRFEGGVDLSGGEWQTVALARGFVRNAALVILDESTAALDAEAEEQLLTRFRTLIAGKTALIISHRFSTVRMADYILVLEDGHIIEAGNHIELIARGGHYASLFEMQAGRYRSAASDTE